MILDRKPKPQAPCLDETFRQYEQKANEKLARVRESAFRDHDDYRKALEEWDLADLSSLRNRILDIVEPHSPEIAVLLIQLAEEVIEEKKRLILESREKAGNGAYAPVVTLPNKSERNLGLRVIDGHKAKRA